MDRLVLPESTGIPTVEEILGRLDPPMAPEGQQIVRDAYALAKESHDGQRRKSGDPYFSHCARVAWLLAELLGDPATIAAGLLHDTIEDCGVTVAQLKDKFPDPVPELVDGVTKISTLNFSSDQEHQVNNLRKMILAMARDVRVVLIKLCDRLHNMLTLQHLPPGRQQAIAQTTMDIYAPLANRLGMTRMRAQLEDLAFQYLNHKMYMRLAKKMAVRHASDQQIVDRTRELLSEKLAANGISAEMYGRRKHLYSLYQKMQRQGLRFEEVHDIVAVRVIAANVADCYGILGIVHSLWKPIAGYMKDYIAAPKENGYRSIHTSVIGVEGGISEIQIRTEQMHRIAEEGIAAHWRYKEVGVAAGGLKGGEERRLAWLRQLVEWLQDVHDPSEFMRELKRDIYENSVFCYTPRGDIIEMPRGATALDLAFRIHTQVGTQCQGVKINNRMAAIRTQLQTGDVIEVQTSKTARPTAEWLQIAKTGRARNKIRHWLKTNERGTYLEYGRHALMNIVRSRFGPQIDEEKVLEILKPSYKHFSVKTPEDLMVEIGCGNIKVTSLITRLDQVLHPPEPARPTVRKAASQTGKKKDLVLVDGMSGAITRMARCCSPLPGEPITGFITQGRGISIHRLNCRSLANIRARSSDFENRLVDVEWSTLGRELRKVVVRITAHDRKGLLSDISTAVTQLNVSITGAHTSSNLSDSTAVLKLEMLIENGDQLNQVINRIDTTPGVLSVSRTVRAK